MRSSREQCAEDRGEHWQLPSEDGQWDGKGGTSCARQLDQEQSAAQSAYQGTEDQQGYAGLHGESSVLW